MEASVGKDKAYAKYAAAWDKFLATHPDDAIGPGIDGVPVAPLGCGPIFTHLPKPALKLLLLRMLHPDPARRAHIGDVLHDRWIRTIESCSSESVEPSADLIDVSKKGAKVDRIAVRKAHNHLPPKQSKFPQHGFDMGNGYR